MFPEPLFVFRTHAHARHTIAVLLQVLFPFQHFLQIAPTQDALLPRGIGLDARRIDGHQSQTRHPRCSNHSQGLHKQIANGLLVSAIKKIDGLVVGVRVGGQIAEG